MVSGIDSATFLQSQISQDIRGLTDGASTYSFVLQPMGKVEALVRVHRFAAERFVIDTDAGFGAATAARLNRFKIRVKVDIETLDWRCIAVRGAPADSRVGSVPAWGLDDAWDLLGPDVAPPAGVGQGSQLDLTRSRVEAGWPAMGREITDATIPAETGRVVSLAVSFTKGCYPGQELVERMDSRGSAAPRFVRRLRSTEEVAAGDLIEHDGKRAGTVTTVADADGGWVALASIARSVAVGATVTVDGHQVVVEDSTPASLGGSLLPPR